MNSLSQEQIARVLAMHLGQKMICTKTVEDFEGDEYKISQGDTGILTLINTGDHHIACDADTESWSLGITFPDCPIACWFDSPFKLCLKPISAISDEDAIEVAKMSMDDPRIEEHDPEEIFAEVTGRDNGKTILDVSYRCWVGTFDIDNDGLIMLIDEGENDCPITSLPAIYQYLIQKGYAVPCWIAPNHPDNGKTAIEMGLALDSTLQPA